MFFFQKGIVGQMVIPIPVVGAVVGSIVGGLAGAVVGQGEGILIGELVEVIDNKIKEKKLNASRENLLATLPEEKAEKLSKSSQDLLEASTTNDNLTKTTAYNVIDKLVFKFDKDLLKEENWSHLKDASQSNQTAELDNGVLTNAKEKINDEDYEIFVLNDTNEIVKNLNIDNCIDSNGAVLKRSSLQAFTADQLPPNINIFFKVLENNSSD